MHIKMCASIAVKVLLLTDNGKLEIELMPAIARGCAGKHCGKTGVGILSDGRCVTFAIGR